MVELGTGDTYHARAGYRRIDHARAGYQGHRLWYGWLIGTPTLLGLVNRDTDHGTAG